MEFLAKAYDAHPRITTGVFFLLMCAITLGTAIASDNADTIFAQRAFMLVSVPTLFVALFSFQVFLVEVLYPES